MVTAGKPGARLHNNGQIRVTLTISEVQEEALEGWQWKTGLSRVTGESVSQGSFPHRKSMHLGSLGSGDVTNSWKLLAFQLYSRFCLPLAHILECVLHSLDLHFCEEASEPVAN